MRIGYPCQNLSVGCTSARTFRLRSYSDSRLAEILESNLDCLETILSFDEEHGIFFFRITSDLVPFASHPVCRYPWQKRYGRRFAAIGRFAKSRGMRMSMHPDQFTLINSPDRGIFERSVKELVYQAEVLDLMELEASVKLQIHVGGAYGDKKTSLARFARRYAKLPAAVKRRLCVENDERLFSLRDCLCVNSETGIPVIFDSFHHSLNNNGETTAIAMEFVSQTWKKKDGLPMVDLSFQKKGARAGTHADSLSVAGFKRFLKDSKPFDLDLMLEIKNKEKSALLALDLARGDKRLVAKMS